MLTRVFLFAMLLASAGIPLYIHLPQFLSAELGLTLSAVSALLIGLRLLDFIQDPLLGRLIDKAPRHRAAIGAGALAAMGAGFVLLFAVPPLVAPMLWAAGALAIIFTGYSTASILFYGQSSALAGSGAMGPLLRLAAFREAGMLAGIILAAMTPLALARLTGGAGYGAFGLALAGCAVLVALLSAPLWRGAPAARPAPFNWAALRGAGGAGLLVLALLNALPVALTSTLFLFFTEDRLGIAPLAGPLLIAFFLAAGLAVPLWTKAAARFGARPVLALAMILSILAFIGAALLPMGASLAFAAICLASGAALGAEMAILPALFAAALDRAGIAGGQAFGLWSFMNKLALALAAAIALPLLDLYGYQSGAANGPAALGALNFAYAIAPCLLKIAAIALLLALPRASFSASASPPG